MSAELVPGREEMTEKRRWADRCSIHDLGLVGHIEDIAVAKDQQGKKLGLRIIQALDHISETVGCYKVRPPAKAMVRHRLEIC